MEPPSVKNAHTSQSQAVKYEYLRTLGFDATNDIFAENAWYFRNSLVRANYNDLKNGIHETTEYRELFLRNLLLGEEHSLHNRTLHVSGTFKVDEKVTTGYVSKADKASGKGRLRLRIPNAKIAGLFRDAVVARFERTLDAGSVAAFIAAM